MPATQRTIRNAWLYIYGQRRRGDSDTYRNGQSLNLIALVSLHFSSTSLPSPLLFFLTLPPFPLPLLLSSPSDLESLFLAFTFNSDCYLTQQNFLLNNSDPIILF